MVDGTTDSVERPGIDAAASDTVAAEDHWELLGAPFDDFGDELLERTLLLDSRIFSQLTEREKQVLRMVMSGLSNKEIARVLCRSERTIEYHRNRLMRKVGVHNAAGLLTRATAMGLS